MGSILKVTKANNTSVWLPDPKRGGLTVTIQDLDSDSTGRNQKGELFRDRVAVKEKYLILHHHYNLLKYHHYYKPLQTSFLL